MIIREPRFTQSSQKEGCPNCGYFDCNGTRCLYSIQGNDDVGYEVFYLGQLAELNTWTTRENAEQRILELAAKGGAG